MGFVPIPDGLRWRNEAQEANEDRNVAGGRNRQGDRGCDDRAEVHRRAMRGRDAELTSFQADAPASLLGSGAIWRVVACWLIPALEAGSVVFLEIAGVLEMAILVSKLMVKPPQMARNGHFVDFEFDITGAEHIACF